MIMRTSAQLSAAILLGTLVALATGCHLSGWHADSSMRTSKPTRDSRQSVAKAPTPEQSLDVQLAFARTLEEQRDPEQAAAAYMKIMQQHPKCSEAVHRLAIIRDQANRFDESRTLFQKALKLQPGRPEIYCDLGYSQYLQRRWTQAEMNLRQAIAIQPEFKRAIIIWVCCWPRPTGATKPWRSSSVRVVRWFRRTSTAPWRSW